MNLNKRDFLKKIDITLDKGWLYQIYCLLLHFWYFQLSNFFITSDMPRYNEFYLTEKCFPILF